MNWDKLLPPEMPTINRIKRADWLDVDDAPTYQKMKPSRIVVHHSYVPNSDQFKGDETVRSIHRHHTKTNGWSDIGYHFIVSPDGLTIYEGRPADVIGAHCGGTPPNGIERNFGNTGSIGICLIGNYDTEEPTRAALYALSILIFSLCDRFGINHDAVFGHCEAWSKPPKTCPGRKLFSELFGVQRWENLKF
jgi:N-acetyl-anhydromuramyl-L-alanine amidase AmpD